MYSGNGHRDFCGIDAVFIASCKCIMNGGIFHITKCLCKIKKIKQRKDCIM